MAISLSTLFTRLGKGFHQMNLVNTSRGTTIPTQAQAVQDQFNSASLALHVAAQNIETAQQAWKSGGVSHQAAAKSYIQQVLLETVKADTTLPSYDMVSLLTELISQMVTAGSTVDASTVSATASACTGNGDGVLVTSTKRPDGKVNENILGETLKLTCTSDSSPTTATFQCKGKASTSDKTSWEWPLGSGANKVLTAVDASATLLGNGSFDDFDDVANKPDEWVVSVGTVGTTIKGGSYEVQVLTITGSPSAGYYTISWSNQSGKVQTTDILAYNASGSSVQGALRALVGLENVTVVTTGTSPNYTHTITFTKVAGNLSQITVNNQTTGGTLTPSTTTNGSANVYVNKALEIVGDGATLTAINRAVSLNALTQYAFNMWAMVDVVPAAGIITVDLVDGIGGSVIADQAGTNNSTTFAVTGMSTSFVAKNVCFRTPKILPSVVYLRIRVSTAITAGSSLFLDQASLVQMDAVYPGGPYASLFSGKTRFYKGDAQTAADYFTIAATNDRAGQFQEWFERVFDMNANGLILPSNTVGGETIDDALIA